jgi:hypothetical protein
MIGVPAKVPARVALRSELPRAGIAAALALALLLPLVLLDRPPARPRLTVIGQGDGLSLLIEGTGGGRVLLGGGAGQVDVAAALGRTFRPWDRALDLLVVAGPRDLPGAVELVRHGGVRAVAAPAFEPSRTVDAGLAALRDACAQAGASLQSLEGRERINVGRDNGMVIEVVPVSADGFAFRLAAGRFAALVSAGAGGVAEATPVAILLQSGVEPYRAALAARPGLLVAPAPPPAAVASDSPGAAGGYLLVVGGAERATLEIDGAGLRLVGPEVQPIGVKREA